MFYLIISILIIVFLSLVIYFSRQVIYPNVYTHQYIIDYELENNPLDLSIFETLKNEKIKLQSYFGYHIQGELYLQDDTSKFILMCHGITNNYDGMKKYCEVYIKNGYSVMLYDHRNHGYSDKNYSTLGFFEKKDAKRCVDYLMKRFKEPLIGIHGVSMGAATAMQLVAIDNRLMFCVEDCGYSDAERLLKHRALEDHNKIIAALLKPSDIYTKLFYNFSYRDSSVIHSINSINCPMLFIHGEDDDYVPYYMVHELHDAYEGEKMLYSVKNAKHAVSIDADRVKYNEIVQTFLDKYIN
jgi:pimeloyl-ACP methyl ester carboxylesterase